MKHQRLLWSVLFVLTWFLFACSPETDTLPVEDVPVLKNGDTVSFTLIQTTDVHHHVVGTGPSASYGTANDTTLGGYSRIARAIQNIRNEKALEGIPTVLVDSGDFFMGTVYDMSLGKSPAAFSFFESMDYDAVTLGNHEFDYGPEALGGFFYLPLVNDINGNPTVQFDVPVIMSNMATDRVAGTDDDYLESLLLAGEIKGSQLMTLDNGLKVGIIGLLGKSAQADAPLTDPLTFYNDLTDAIHVAVIQDAVDTLRADGAQVVIALSHSGIIDPNGTPAGDDIDLANAVTGIDIIASGHYHQMTQDVVEENGTYIICAGRYGENVAQLDVTVTVGSGITGTPALTNNTIDSSLKESDVVKMLLVGNLDNGINDALDENGLPEVNDVLAVTDSDNLAIPDSAGETGIGNLASDSLRGLLQGQYTAMSIVANGVIRNGYAQGQNISFADVYNTLPLGMTPDASNQTIPGYPLLLIYLDKTSIRSLCQLSAFAISAAAGNPYLTDLKSDYYLNFSGIQYSYSSVSYGVDEANVYLFGASDLTCSKGPAAPVSYLGTSLIPCVVDLYTAYVFLSDDMETLITKLNGYITLAGLGVDPIVIQPKINIGTAASPDLVDISGANVLADRLDMYPLVEGTQEVKEWMALYQFILNLPEAPTSTVESPVYLIPDALYGEDALNSANASRVNSM